MLLLRFFQIVDSNVSPLFFFVSTATVAIILRIPLLNNPGQTGHSCFPIGPKDSIGGDASDSIQYIL